MRILRILLIAGVTALSAPPLVGQIQIFITEPEDKTIEAGGLVLMELWPIGLRSTAAFQGVCCDRGSSIDVSERNFGVGDFIRFNTGPLFETTQYWFQTCSDFGCDESRTVTVTVIPEEAPGPPAALAGASDLGQDWWFSDWFGSFNIEFAADGWIFHAQHGWTFLFNGGTPEDIFLFDLSTGAWFWTAASQYPNLFSFSRGAWIFYFEDTQGPRRFVDLQSGEFFDLE